MSDAISEKVVPLIKDVCQKIKNKAPRQLLSKVWNLATLPWDLHIEWFRLLDVLEPKYSSKLAEESRVAIMASADETADRDSIERNLFFLPQKFHRVVEVRYRESGILLPFGADLSAFNKPNPWVFRSSCLRSIFWHFRIVPFTPEKENISDLFRK